MAEKAQEPPAVKEESATHIAPPAAVEDDSDPDFDDLDGA